MSSTIYFNNLTVIDYSTIDATGMMVGGSANLCVSVTGPVETEEGVVLDFSAGKNQIKAAIDGQTGFDHKCWVPIDDPCIVIESELEHTTIKHSLSGLVIKAPHDCFAYIERGKPVEAITQFLESQFDSLAFSSVYLNNTVIPAPACNTDAYVFRYVHGLKSSSSYGCKNIVHGHKSYIQAIADNPQDPRVHHTLELISNALNNCIFAHVDDKGMSGQLNTIAYDAPGRGEMFMQYQQKTIVLETQTTIEHIVEYVAARFYDLLRSAGITAIYVSEGLCKGATTTI